MLLRLTIAICLLKIAIVHKNYDEKYLSTKSVTISGSGSTDDIRWQDIHIKAGINDDYDTTINWTKFRERMLKGMYPDPHGWDQLTENDKKQIINNWNTK